ncbi:MAG: mitochondrial fission ELM1 family protein [Acetobacter syzygii]|uniref:mitochondrial fission ELM1 family protein n=1 Tax=Acetobacter syzygii TaxID=146476 RepID=UPI00242BEBBD|nr:mitochondrial fission ELM1 family protein [Acetobacter syzygii]
MASAMYAGAQTGSNPTEVLPCAQPHAFVVGENFAGMRSQALGLTNRAGWHGVFQPVCPGRVARMALAGPRWLGKPCLRGSSGQTLESHADLLRADVVISIGGKGGAIGAALRSSCRPVVQIQNPRQSLARFDLVIACRHDDISGPNVLLGRTALHGLTPEELEHAKQEWEPKLAHLPRPLVAALVGGSNGRFQLGEAEARRLANVLVQTRQAEGGSLIVTASRRTDPQALAVLKEIIEPAGGYVWDGEGENPYIGLIACADNLLVTIDSVSMMSESVAGHAPVTVFPLPGKSRRISEFVEELELAGRVRVLGESATRLPAPWYVTPLDDTPELVGEMHNRLGF